VSFPEVFEAVRRAAGSAWSGSCPEVLYHYTSADGFLGIAQSKRLFVSHALFLNDATEINRGLALFRRHLVEESKRRAPRGDIAKSLLRGTAALRGLLDLHCYVASFSAKRDLLSQWRGYGSSPVGYAIGFHSETLREAGLTAGRLGNASCLLAKCIYGVDMHQKVVARCVDHFLSTRIEGPPASARSRKNRPATLSCSFDEAMRDFAFAATAVCAFLKSEHFREEDEWRLLVGPYLGLPADTKYRVRGALLVPYVELVLDRLSPDYMYVPEILLGPNHLMELNMRVTKTLCFGLKFECGSIAPSKIPFRRV